MNTDIKVLVVDDSMLSRVSIKSMLNNFGITEIIDAADGKQALKHLQMDSPNLMILDLLMPEMDGFQVLKEKQTMENECEVIILSADIQETTVKQALDLGARFFLNKPIKEKELQEILNELFEK